MAQKKIHTRGLTSFFTLFGFLIMSITGLALYVVPAGRVAYWVNWDLFGLTKTDWGNIHILSSLLFIVAGAFHIYFNWRPLMNYFKSKVTKGFRLKWELAISLAASVLIVVSALHPFPPLGYLLDFNEYVKEAWVVKDDYEPPFGHAELMSLNTFTQKMDINLDSALAEFKDNGLTVGNPEASLEEIAAANGISPMSLYLLIKKFEPRPDTTRDLTYTADQVEIEFSGTGVGNRTLTAICEKTGLDISTARARLADAGIELADDETIKKAAERHDLDPLDIMKIILVEGYIAKPEAGN